MVQSMSSLTTKGLALIIESFRRWQECASLGMNFVFLLLIISIAAAILITYFGYEKWVELKYY